MSKSWGEYEASFVLQDHKKNADIMKEDVKELKHKEKNVGFSSIENGTGQTALNSMRKKFKNPNLLYFVGALLAIFGQASQKCNPQISR